MTPSEPLLDAAFLRYLASQADESVTLEQVRSALAKIPGSMAEDFRCERDERAVSFQLATKEESQRLLAADLPLAYPWSPRQLLLWPI